MRVRALDHVQLAMPEGGEAAARAFYRDALGIREVPKLAHLAARGGCWFEDGALKLHLGVEREFRAVRKAHPALLVEDLPALAARLRDRGYRVVADAPIERHDRLYADDPFGNRIELIEPHDRAD